MITLLALITAETKISRKTDATTINSSATPGANSTVQCALISSPGFALANFASTRAVHASSSFSALPQ